MYFLETGTRRFIGDVSDKKPSLGLQADGTTLTALDLPVGSSLMEIDRLERRLTVYRWSGIDWIRAAPEQEIAPLLEALLFELASLRETLTLALADDADPQ